MKGTRMSSGHVLYHLCDCGPRVICEMKIIFVSILPREIVCDFQEGRNRSSFFLIFLNARIVIGIFYM